jgi:hypothetical protein
VRGSFLFQPDADKKFYMVAGKDSRDRRTKTMKGTIALSDRYIFNKIHFIRGQKVMLDSDLAELFGVKTKVFNQAVLRNLKRFPIDFMFRLDQKEFESLRSQFVTSNRGGRRSPPLVFTEQGVAMLSGVLTSSTAIRMNIRIIRIFIRIKDLLHEHKDILLKLEKLERSMLGNEKLIVKHGEEIQLLFAAVKRLLHKPKAPRKKIGFRRSSE